MADQPHVHVTIEGDEAIQRALRGMVEDLRRLAPDDAARALEAGASAAAPRDTGRLAASLAGRVESDRVVLTSNLRYARPVAAKTGFVAQALASAWPQVTRAYSRELQGLCGAVHRAG